MHLDIQQTYPQQYLHPFSCFQAPTVSNCCAPTTKRIQNYTFSFGDLIGQGNFSKVYKGYHEITHETVAIKVVELSSITSPTLLDLLYSEIEIIKTLNHPNVLRCYQVLTSQNNCYIITQYCNGGDLASKIKARGPALADAETCKTIHQIYQGLEYLASHSIIHRDFKSANILFHNGVAKIADFGFAKRTKQKFKDVSIGSPVYMSPEGLLDNIYGPKTDVWAFGVVLFEIFHGETPLNFCRTQQELKLHILVPLRYESMKQCLPFNVKQLLMRCLEINESIRIPISEIARLPFIHNMRHQRNTIEESLPGIPLKFQMQQQQFLQSSNPEYPKISVYDPALNNITLNHPPPNNFESRKRGMSFQEDKHLQKQPSLGQMHRSHGREPLPREQIVTTPLRPHTMLNQCSKIVSAFTMINFHECVNMLHYCRLLYKTIQAMQQLRLSIPTSFESVQALKCFLYDVLKELQAKLLSGVDYGTDKPFLRQKKLQDVIRQYMDKYCSELQLQTVRNSQTQETTLKHIQAICLNSLSLFYPSIQNRSLSSSAMMLVSSLAYIFEVGLRLQKGLASGDYSGFMEETNIELFLNSKCYVDENGCQSVKARVETIMNSGIGQNFRKSANNSVMRRGLQLQQRKSTA